MKLDCDHIPVTVDDGDDRKHWRQISMTHFIESGLA